MSGVMSVKEFEASKISVLQDNFKQIDALIRHSDDLDLKNEVHIQVHFVLAQKIQELTDEINRLNDMNYESYTTLWEESQ